MQTARKIAELEKRILASRQNARKWLLHAARLRVEQSELSCDEKFRKLIIERLHHTLSVLRLTDGLLEELEKGMDATPAGDTMVAMKIEFQDITGKDYPTGRDIGSHEQTEHVGRAPE